MADVLFHNTPSIKCLQLLQKEECLNAYVTKPKFLSAGANIGIKFQSLKLLPINFIHPKGFLFKCGAMLFLSGSHEPSVNSK